MKIYQISVDYFKYMLLYTLHICLKDVEYQLQVFLRVIIFTHVQIVIFFNNSVITVYIVSNIQHIFLHMTLT